MLTERVSMLTDGTDEAWDGVKSVANMAADGNVANMAADRDGSVLTVLLLALLVFAFGAASGFIARLLWPNSR